MRIMKLSADHILKNAGLRRTPVRVAVLEMLSRARGPVAVPDMLAKLPGQTDAVTVYRTLNTFTGKKLVHRIQGEDRSWRYAMGSSQAHAAHRHPHFVCEACDKVECLGDAKIPSQLSRAMGVGKTYSVRYAEVVLHGVCPKCR